MQKTDLPLEVRARYTRMRKVDDELFLGLKRFMAHWRIHLVMADGEVFDQWCFDALNDALLAFSTWNGRGEPVRWSRHPPTGRVRDPVTGVVWAQDDPPVVF